MTRTRQRLARWAAAVVSIVLAAVAVEIYLRSTRSVQSLFGRTFYLSVGRSAGSLGITDGDGRMALRPRAR